ncbi:MAG: DUF11 domain-containing protein, partial [Chloroflexota bacterium]|nr:DUF11 domain-containing protein [Chloroflexota bacterium]
LNDLRIFKTVDRGQAAPGETVRYTINVLNAGTNTATGVRLIDDVPAGLVIDPAHSTTSLGTPEFRDKSFIANVGTLAPGAQFSVSLTTGVNSNGGARIANTARVVSDQNTAGIASNTVEVVVSGAGTPQPTKAVINNVSLTPGAKPTTKPAAKPTAKATGGAGSTGNVTGSVTGNVTGNTIPKTGGEFPLLGLLLGIAMLVTRQIRLRAQAQAGRKA